MVRKKMHLKIYGVIEDQIDKVYLLYPGYWKLPKFITETIQMCDVSEFNHC